MPFLPKNIPECYGGTLGRVVLEFELGGPLTYLGDWPPGCEMPERSPFTSAMNTGMPSRLKFSASTCKVTVFPVPVAPAINPWRFAIWGKKKISDEPRAIRIGSEDMIYKSGA